MTQYVINIGTFPNDGTGDPLRTAFNEVNLNFDQVFAAGPVLSNVRIANNTILTTNTNGNLILAPNGIGVVQSNVNIVPNTSNIRNLGSADRRWSTLYIQYANISGAITVADLTATGNVTVGGNLSVTGNVINIGNIITDAKTIQLANTAVTANSANGSGITVGANDAIATFLFDSANTAWTTNIGLQVGGPITGTSLAVSDATIYGNTNGVDAYFTGTVTSPNIVVNNITSDDSTFVTVQDGLDVQGDIAADTLSVTGNVSAGNLSAAGNVLGFGIYSGNIFNADGVYSKFGAFTGYNGRGIDAIVAGVDGGTFLGTDVIIQITGNSNAYTQFNFQNINDGTQASTDYVITANDGDDTTKFLNVGLTNSNWDGTQDNSLGNLIGPNDGYFYVQDGNLAIGTKANANAFIWKFDNTGNVTATGNLIPSANATYSLGNSTNWWSNIWVAGNTIYIGGVPVGMGAGNVLTVNGNAVLQNDSNTTISTTGNITADYFFGNGSQLTGIETSRIFNGNSNVEIPTANGNITVTANGSATWTFDTTGNLTTSSNLVIGPSPAGGSSILQPDSALQVVGEGANAFVVSGWAANTNAPDSIAVVAFNAPYANGASNVQIAVGNNATTVNYWNFGNDGNLTLPQGGIINEQANPDGFPGHAIVLTPTTVIDPTQQLWVYPTGGSDYNHLHLTSGNLYNTELFLGNDNLYVKLANTGNIVVNTNDNGGNFAQWTFDTTGNINLPTNGSINFNAGGIVQKPDEDFVITVNDADDDGFAIFNRITDENGNVMAETEMQRDRLNIVLDVQGAGYQWQFSDNGQLYLPGNVSGNYGASTSFYATDNGSSGSMEMKVISYIGDTLGSNIRVTQSNATISTSAAAYTWTFDNTGNLTAPGNISANGSINTGGNVNFTGAEATDTARIFADVTGSNTSLVLEVGDDNADSIVLRHYSFAAGNTIDMLTATRVSNTTANVSVAGNISATGNITGNYFIGDGSQLTGLPASYTDSNVTTLLSNLGSNVVSGTGNITTTANISGNYFIGNGSQLTGLPSSYTDSNVSTFLASFGSNTISTTGNITAANFIGNIEITGNISGTSANVELVAGVYEWTFDNAGNLTLPGNTFAVNYANGTAVSLGGAGSYGNANVADFLDSLGSNAIVTTGNITGGNLISSATLFANPDLILGNTANASATKTRIVTDTTFSYIQTGNGTVGSTGNIVFSPYASSTQRVVIDTASGNVSATGNITAANLGNIANINLNGNSSQVLYGNGVFAAVAGGSYGDANVATFLGTYGSNTISSTGNITTTATANVGTLAVTGNATVSGIGSNLIRRASGLVAADTNVTLDDLSANVTSSGSQLAISTSGSWQGTGWTESFVGAGVSVQNWVNLPMNPGYAFASQAMNSQGHGCRCVISDQTPTAKVYQITVVRSGTTGAQWNITIERLV
jgi:hypothetical protein